MTMLVARQPLHALPMSSAQRPNRRGSARLQEKDDAPLFSAHAPIHGKSKAHGTGTDPVRAETTKIGNEKKRKMNYDEDDDGFLFKRVKNKKPEAQRGEREAKTGYTQKNVGPAQTPPGRATVQRDGEETKPQHQRQRKRLSFSTPKQREEVPVRRSKRLSRDNDQQDETSAKKSPGKGQSKGPRKQIEARPEDVQKAQTQPLESRPNNSPKPKDHELPTPTPKDQRTDTVPTQQEDHSSTKIALPFADTPVIKRNKAMREGKGGKGERRSSLGLRGRRASSLIETGNSHALPHDEVDIPDFYKHIESEGLPEPRRMRQLLTWCATRTLDEKPIGTDFEDASARSAARVIEEELLKDLANKSELSDWFGREDVAIQKSALPQRPNPKNVQNVEKIAELEEQIKRLRAEKEALETLLRPPNVPNLRNNETSIYTKGHSLDRSLLSEADLAALENSSTDSASPALISGRLNALYQALGPNIDRFADGVHTIGQFRDAADNVAGRTLAICADKLAQRENEGRKRALATGPGSPPKDLGGVLRSLSKAER